MSPRSTTRPLYFWCFVSYSAFFRWQMSISEAKWTFTIFVLASSITSFVLLTFVRFHAEIFSSFSHSLSTAAFAAGIFMAWGIVINSCTMPLVIKKKVCTKFLGCSELSPFPAIWSSWWFGKDSSIRILVDSLASKIHANLDLKSLVVPRVSPYLLFFLHVLQGTAGAIGVSNFSSIPNVFFELLVLRVSEIDSS